MNPVLRLFSLILGCTLWLGGVKAQQRLTWNLDSLIHYCTSQAHKTQQKITDRNKIPVRGTAGSSHWSYSDKYDWRSGFWPGIQWNLFEATNDPFWRENALATTDPLAGILNGHYFDHDLGFQLYCSMGNAIRLMPDEDYKKTLLRAADSLASLFNPKVGTILSWPNQVAKMNWPHNTIMDNMINLELLLWAAKNGGGNHLRTIALKHAETTMKNHFRIDHTSYHVVVYDTVTGKKIKGVTHQGYANTSMWARGQAWSIYGFAMMYKHTGKKEFLTQAQKAATVFLEKLPADLIPYWDFNDPAIPNAPKDASAAAIAACGMLDLAVSGNKKQKTKYLDAAKKIITELSAHYRGDNLNDAFLLHSTGHKPAGKDIDVPLIYADYYYLEALLKLKKMNANIIIQRT